MSESVTPSPHGSDEVSEVRSHNVIGGTIVAVLGLALLGFSFYMPNTTMVPATMHGSAAPLGAAASNAASNRCG